MLVALGIGAPLALGPDVGFLAGSARAAAPAEQVFDLKVVGGQLPEKLRRLRVKQGDSVRLRWSVDAPMVLHLHGYDIEKTVTPGRTTEFRFEAHATGRFPVNVHRQGAAHDDEPLTMLEVYPR